MAHSLRSIICCKKPMKTIRKPPESLLKREKKARKALEHRTKCQEHAEMVKNGAISNKNAAKECGISERQMAHHVARAMKEPKACSVPETVNFPVTSTL